MSLDDDLKKLPTLEGDPAARDRARARALGAFTDEHALRGEPFMVVLVHRASRLLVPTLVTAGAAVYLIWAFRAASALYP